MRHYNLGFISDEDIYNHVKETVMRYSASINLREFNKNIVDPIKLTFDAKVYGKTMEEVVASECMRQMDKSNNNHIGYFHQNLFRYAGHGWTVPPEGFDVVNEEMHIFVEMKNNLNKMKHKEQRLMMMRMFDKLLKDSKATCLMVDLSKYNSVEMPWIVDVDGCKYSDERIKYCSISRFYEIAFGHKDAYQVLCSSLPTILSDIN